MAIVATHVAAVQELYVAYFGRPADTAGLEYWTNIVEANKGVTAAVSATFAVSPEYTAAFAGMSNAQIVDKIYSNMFGRGASTVDGREYWVNLLNAGTVKVNTIVAEVAKGAQTTDKEAVENKVAGATAFTVALDQPAENAGYNGPAALNLAKAFISSITTDASLTAAIAPAALNTTVAGVVAAGTPFTLTSGLNALQAANAAKQAFLDGTDGTVDGKVAAGAEAKIGTNVTTAVKGVETAGVAGYEAAGTANLRAALVADKVAANQTALTNAQTSVTNANAEIAKVAGLTAAVATLTAATTASSTAVKAQTTAQADLAAKEASFEVLNGNSNITIDPANGTVANLIVQNTAKTALVLAPNVTETTNPGVTALLASINSKMAADVAVANAAKVVTSAQANVNYLDMGTSEINALEAIKALMKDVPVAAGALPTMAQIATQKAILDAGTDTAAKAAFDTAVGTYDNAAPTNARVAALTSATSSATDANKAIETLTKATTALSTAVAVQDQLVSVNGSIAAATKAFVDNGLVAPQEVSGAVLATAASDIYIAGKTDGSINLFGLLGKDALYIGTGYTLNSTATTNATTGVITGGNDSVLEAFIFKGTDGAHIVLEQSIFGSSATNAEVVEITLVGIDVANVQLNNGIITIA